MGVLSKAALAAVQLSGLAAAQFAVNANSKLQVIDGFGISQAFGRASQFQAAASAMQKQALDYLFNTTTGAGFSIIRNRIGSGGSGDSIEPTGPASPSSTPTYVWDGSDAGQVWFSQQAMSYGVKTIYADAWSAPGFMKTNGNDANGGYLCGTTGHTCSSGDWRQAYANFLTKYIQYYASAGIPITQVGFLNEPDYTTSYSSMQISTNAQEAISFIPTLRSTLNSAGLSSIEIACCDATGWPNQKTYTTALMAAGMQSSGLGLITSHTYSGFPTSPLTTPLRTWITEGCPEGNPFVSTWYASGGVTEGMTYANYLATGFVNANVSAWVFWEGFEINQQTSESHLLDTSGSDVVTSGVYWAFVMWSRWIRPGAHRLTLTGSVSGVVAFAAQNTDGSVVVVLTNSGSAAQSPSISFSGFTAGAAQAWVTSNGQQAASTGATLSGGAVTVSVPAQGVVTIKLTAGSSSGSSSTTLKTSTTTAAATTSSTTSKTSSTSTTTSKTSTSTAATTTSTSCSALYGQCGGIGWTGPTCCAAGSTCKYSNDWYSQCLA